MQPPAPDETALSPLTKWRLPAMDESGRFSVGETAAHVNLDLEPRCLERRLAREPRPLLRAPGVHGRRNAEFGFEMLDSDVAWVVAV
eukprot:6198146-Pleurochrysis_carterae.AAC.2